MLLFNGKYYIGERNMSKYDAMLKRGEYSLLYKELNGDGMLYNLENICKPFKKVAAREIYYYMIYSLSRRETSDRYITICEVLEYLDQFVDDNYSLIRWYISKGIESIGEPLELKKWIIETYFSSPCGPYKEDELLIFAKDILCAEPHHKESLTLLGKLE